MVAIIFWKSKPWTGCYGCDRNLVICYGFDPNRNPDRNPGRNLCFRKLLWFRSEIATLIATLIETLVETLVETSVPGLRTGFRSGLRSGFRFATLNRNLKVLKFATLGGFLWLRSGLRTGLRTGFRLQFCNPETFWNGGDNYVSTRVSNRVSIRIAITTLNRNPET